MQRRVRTSAAADSDGGGGSGRCDVVGSVSARRLHLALEVAHSLTHSFVIAVSLFADTCR